MPAPSTCEALLELVRKSGIVDSQRLDAHVQKLRDGGEMPAKPRELAAALLRDGLLTQFQAKQLMLGKWRGFTFGKYKVLEQLGSGGMSTVYLCEHLLMRRRVAIKILPVAKAQDPATVARFYREARAAAALDHPNIARAFDVDQDGQLHFIVMEYIDGSSLFDIVKKTGPMDIARACHYTRQAVVGLQHIHENKLVHRDIKPNNLILDRQGTVKILDLGLARFFQSDNDQKDALTQQFDKHTVMGTADYLAPEQAMNLHEVDIRADLYSLGATLYYLLAGKPPFEGKSITQKLLLHQIKPPTPITDIRPEVPGELAALIDKLMRKDPAERFQTPAELLEALELWTQTPIPPPPEEEMPKLCAAAMNVSPSEGPDTLPPASTSFRTPARPTPPRSVVQQPVMLQPIAVEELPLAIPTEVEIAAHIDTSVSPQRPPRTGAVRPASPPPRTPPRTGPIAQQRPVMVKTISSYFANRSGVPLFAVLAVSLITSIVGGAFVWSMFTGALERPLTPPPEPTAPIAVNTTAPYDARFHRQPGGQPPAAVDPRSRPTLVQWRIEDGGNGHYYEFISGKLTWNEAKRLAETRVRNGVKGHLATLTTRKEIDFFRSKILLRQGWLGGYQDVRAPDYSEPTSGWRWVTGEPWGFSNWGIDEPNNRGPEHYLELCDDGTWNDAADAHPSIEGFYVEYPTTGS
jgi:serine/threonine protein kinase